MRTIVAAAGAAAALAAAAAAMFVTRAPARLMSSSSPMSFDAAAPKDDDTLAAVGPQPLTLRVVQYVGGATFGPAPDPSGTMTSLTDIYDPVNVHVTVQAQAPIPYPIQGSRPQPEELQRLIGGSAATGSGWSVTMFLMKAGPQPGDLGVMLAEDTRDRFAVFAGELGNAPTRILRTTAHELGHSLNVFHNDSDADRDCCYGDSKPKIGHTVMNPDRCLAPVWGFGFSDAEREHLMRHPIGKIRPRSGARFGECIAAHSKKC